jgi:hypothetical protein
MDDGVIVRRDAMVVSCFLCCVSGVVGACGAWLAVRETKSKFKNIQLN